MRNKEKDSIRKALIASRKTLEDNYMEAASAAVMDHLSNLAEYKNASNIFIYIDMNKELPTKGIIERAVADSKKVYIPKVENARDMAFYRFKGFDRLVDGPFGLKEPVPEELGIPSEKDLVCLPGVAFSRDGYRLGYGAGYYDNYLNGKAPVKAGICYDNQLLDSLPAEEHDQPVDMIIAPSGIYRI